MLNHTAVTPNPLPLNQLIAIDPRAMRCSSFHRPAKTANRKHSNGAENPFGERDPASFASPFCNPKF